MFPSLETHCLKPPSLSLSLTSVSKSFIIENSSLTYRSSSENWIDSHPIKARPLRICNSYSESGSISPQAPENIPLSLELEPITSESQFYRIVAESQGCQESFLVLWMAKWCRKCIYLKPKLEKLAADYSPRMRFYSVDVNNVPHKLVVSAGVTKMPTVQLWRNGRKQVEVIGGHKAYLVVNEVREIIENEDSLS